MLCNMLISVNPSCYRFIIIQFYLRGRDFTRTWPRFTWWVSHVKHETLTLLEHLVSPPLSFQRRFICISLPFVFQFWVRITILSTEFYSFFSLSTGGYRYAQHMTRFPKLRMTILSKYMYPYFWRRFWGVEDCEELEYGLVIWSTSASWTECLNSLSSENSGWRHYETF